jgi:glycosyltransferase involved in cell wall biosynthesis
MSNSSFFDAYYYEHGCGRPYERDEGWLNFFDGIAKRIIEESEPKTVLDAGCALGFLVEAFRNRGVEAFGVDISKYAIENVYADIKPYCWVGSVCEPFPQKYDLITSIEVLEHLPQPDSEKAIANLCAHANEIIFSSTPFDYKESTHFNVQPPEYWAEQFARCGFYRDLESDMSFITPWAVKFVKTNRSNPRLVREYERKFWYLWKENTDLRSLSAEMRQNLSEQAEQVRMLRQQAEEKEHQVKENTSSKAWNIALLFHRIRIFILPPNSHRDRFLRQLINFFFLKNIARSRKIKNDAALVNSSGLFDKEWYLANNPDVAQAKIEPLFHYLRHGGFEGRDPGPGFYSNWYLDAYEDVKNAGMNPLIHYVKYGRNEGRSAQPEQAVQMQFSSVPSDYDRWIATNEPSPSDLEIQRTEALKLGYTPLISVVVPVWKTPKKILEQTISSVIQQTYENWELCITDGDSDSETEQVLLDWARKDHRIRIKFLDENKGIATNSNEAIALAQGEFVGFLDHDDLLAPFALFEIVSRLQLDKNVDVIYSDEDKTDEEEQRFDSFFKPDFSPDYLRSVNYMPHFLVVRKSLGDQVAWFREGYDGAQDYDLILRLVEKARVIAHIPKVLYHWRVWTASTAGGVDAKPYANASGKKALQDHLERAGLSAQVKDGYSSTLYRVHYHSSSTPLISIIIPNHDHAMDLKRCIDSILQNTAYPNFEIFLIENRSKEQETFKLYEQIKQDPRVHIIKWDWPFNYSRVNNWAATQASGEVFLFLDNDIQVINKDWLEQMFQFAIRPDVGAVGAKLYYPDGTIEHGGIIIGLGGVAGYSHRHSPKDDPGYFYQLALPHNVSAVASTCLMLRKQVFQEVDGFDENYPLALGDIDLCLRILQKGYLNIWTPYAELYHYKSETCKSRYSIKDPEKLKKEIKFFKRIWAKFLQAGDPYYNPNLTLERENFDMNLPRF